MVARTRSSNEVIAVSPNRASGSTPNANKAAAADHTAVQLISSDDSDNDDATPQIVKPPSTRARPTSATTPAAAGPSGPSKSAGDAYTIPNASATEGPESHNQGGPQMSRNLLNMLDEDDEDELLLEEDSEDVIHQAQVWRLIAGAVDHGIPSAPALALLEGTNTHIRLRSLTVGMTTEVRSLAGEILRLEAITGVGQKTAIAQAAILNQLQQELLTTHIPHSSSILGHINNASTLVGAEKHGAPRKSAAKGKASVGLKAGKKRKKADEGEASDDAGTAKKGKKKGKQSARDSD